MESRTGIDRPLRTVVIGSGNVASAIVPELKKVGAVDVCQVYSPTMAHAQQLADKLGKCTATDRPEDVVSDAELYFVAVKDDAIAGLAYVMPRNDAIWLHTSGGVESSKLAALTSHYGVFYPLQTFSKGVNVDVSCIPVFVEGSNEATLWVAENMARMLTDKVYEADGPKRARLHAAAVFACNFTNHLWAISDDILRRETGTDLSVLEPLLQETMRKALSMRPADGQTGPAVRGDRGVIEKHKSLLTGEEAEIYEYLSQKIMKYHELD
ncbi:MAG: F420-dependent NADP oxidoreductase [Bacteroides sp.]|nr:F420-dependent NADP oxidoreductase [Bacteroides sp.]MCM1413993.1 F420-dependent NADP oxidoreductase [Bacteroides sp.]MCM1472312.1 F420-dependent NADP oxidoreductase [Bacteroides sp.]